VSHPRDPGRHGQKAFICLSKTQKCQSEIPGQKWVHKKCSGIKGSMSKVAKSFICRGCLNPVTSRGVLVRERGGNRSPKSKFTTTPLVASAGRTGVDIGAMQSWN